MQNNTTIVIEQVGNGYQVRPMTALNDVICFADVMVFQDMGFASAARDYQDAKDTLLGFIEAHFRKEASHAA